MQSTSGIKGSRALPIEGIQRVAAANAKADSATNIPVRRHLAVGAGHVVGGRKTESMGLDARRRFRIEAEARRIVLHRLGVEAEPWDVRSEVEHGLFPESVWRTPSVNSPNPSVRELGIYYLSY